MENIGLAKFHEIENGMMRLIRDSCLRAELLLDFGEMILRSMCEGCGRNYI